MSTDQSPEIGYGKKSDEAIRRVRSLIAEGEVAAGEHLRQDDIALRIGMTRVPVREAFKTLVADGVLVHKPNHGHYVAGRSSEELQQIAWIRDSCENLLAESAMVPDPIQLAELQVSNNEFRNTAGGTPYQMLEADHAFHRKLWQLSPLRIVDQEAERMWRMLGPYWQLMEFTAETTLRMCNEHDVILGSLERGDRAGYAAAVEQHHSYLREVLGRLDSSERGE